MKGLFSSDEIKELIDCQWLADALYIDGQKAGYCCFEYLLKLIDSEIKISEIPNERLVSIYEQLCDFKSNMASLFQFFESELLNSIIEKYKNLVTCEFERRKDNPFNDLV